MNKAGLPTVGPISALPFSDKIQWRLAASGIAVPLQDGYSFTVTSSSGIFTRFPIKPLPRCLARTV